MIPMLPKLELNPGNLVYIPDDPHALSPVDLDFHEPMTLNRSMKFEAEFTGTINAPLLNELAGVCRTLSISCLVDEPPKKSRNKLLIL